MASSFDADALRRTLDRLAEADLDRLYGALDPSGSPVLPPAVYGATDHRRVRRDALLRAARWGRLPDDALSRGLLRRAGYDTGAAVAPPVAGGLAVPRVPTPPDPDASEALPAAAITGPAWRHADAAIAGARGGLVFEGDAVTLGARVTNVPDGARVFFDVYAGGRHLGRSRGEASGLVAGGSAEAVWTAVVPDDVAASVGEGGAEALFELKASVRGPAGTQQAGQVLETERVPLPLRFIVGHARMWPGGPPIPSLPYRILRLGEDPAAEPDVLFEGVAADDGLLVGPAPWAEQMRIVFPSLDTLYPSARRYAST